MPDNQSENINFLPHDRRQKPARKADEAQIEYAEPAAVESTADFLLPADRPKAGWLARRKLPPLPSGAAPEPVEQPSAEKMPEQPAEPKAGLWSRMISRWRRRLEQSAKPVIEPAAAAETTAETAKEETAKSIAASPPEDIEDIKEKTKEPEMTEPDAPLPAAAESELDINLLSAEYAKTFAAARQKQVFFWSLTVAALTIALFYLTAHLFEQRSRNQVAAAAAAAGKLASDIAAYQNASREDKDLRRKVTAVKLLLAKHISFRTFLEKLEQATIPEVTYLNIAVAQTGGLTLAARARDYTALARQLVVFSQKAPWLREVNLTAARLVGEGKTKKREVGFDLSLKVDEEAFLSDEENAKQ